MPGFRRNRTGHDIGRMGRLSGEDIDRIFAVLCTKHEDYLKMGSVEADQEAIALAETRGRFMNEFM